MMKKIMSITVERDGAEHPEDFVLLCTYLSEIGP
jgi:hypothetical protein